MADIKTDPDKDLPATETSERQVGLPKGTPLDPGKLQAKAIRDEKLKAALRQNLRRRKAGPMDET